MSRDEDLFGLGQAQEARQVVLDFSQTYLAYLGPVLEPVRRLGLRDDRGDFLRGVIQYPTFLNRNAFIVTWKDYQTIPN